ncbi:MAG TPA: hypothetical protein VFV31_11175 [Chitinophagaceae bacterium]|nr:hypothetical protein [Chitinophagaceae bacterium]
MKNILPAGLLVLIFASCKKEVTELPPETQTGANTFAAKVNGEIWVPQGFGPFPANNLLEVRKLGPNMYIHARNFSRSPKETEFEFFLMDVTGPGVYRLNSTSSYPTQAVSYGYYVKRNLTPTNEFMTSATHTGTVTITKLDTVNFIVSGTFQFTASDIFGADPPITVSEGRFDIDF